MKKIKMQKSVKNEEEKNVQIRYGTVQMTEKKKKG